MDQNLGSNYLGMSKGDVDTQVKKTGGSKKCNQCEYASSWAGNLRRHLKKHSGEKSNKCNQCAYASTDVGNLRKRLKTHGGVK